MHDIRRISPGRSNVADLLLQSQNHIGRLYPEESSHLDDADQLAKPNVYFLGVFDNGVLVGIGAVKKQEDDISYGEIKRLFVVPHFRGNGVSNKLMDELEKHLMDENISICRLETGVKQPEALGLYEKRGYFRRGPFAPYHPDPLSLFMEKKLF